MPLVSSCRSITCSGVATGAASSMGLCFLLPLYDCQLLLKAGISQVDPHDEPVQLGFRQGEDAVVLHRIQSGYDQERPGHGVGHAVYGGLMLLHCLKQGSLGL